MTGRPLRQLLLHSALGGVPVLIGAERRLTRRSDWTGVKAAEGEGSDRRSAYAFHHIPSLSWKYRYLLPSDPRIEGEEEKGEQSA